MDTIENSALLYVNKADSVHIPDSCITIRGGNFTYVTSYNREDKVLDMYIPSSVSNVSDNTFGVADGEVIRIHGAKGSDAEKLASSIGAEFVEE